MTHHHLIHTHHTMQAFICILSLINQLIQASQVDGETWAPTSHFYNEYKNYNDLQSYLSRMTDVLFCVPTQKTPKFVVPYPQWLQQECNGKTQDFKIGVYSSYTGTEYNRYSQTFVDTLKDMVQFDSIIRGNLDIKNGLAKVCAAQKPNQYICESQNVVKDKVLKEHEHHVALLRQNFKLADFIPEEFQVVKRANEISFDGTDWAPLLRFIHLTPNELYSLHSFLKSNSDGGELRKNLKQLVNSLVEELNSINFKSPDSPMSTLKMEDESLTNFEKKFKDLTISIPKTIAVGKELFDDLSSKILIPKVLSKYFNEPICESKVISESFFKFDPSDALDRNLMGTIFRVLHYCNEASPFPIRYIAGLGTDRVLSRAKQWKVIQIMGKILTESTAEELTERFLFTLRYEEAQSGSRRLARQSVERLLRMKQDELKTKMTKMFEALKKTLVEHPEWLLIYDIDPVLDMYNDLPMYYRNIFPNAVLTKYLLAIKPGGACEQVAKNSGTALKTLLSNMKKERTPSVEENNSKMIEFENNLIRNVYKCINEPIPERKIVVDDVVGDTQETGFEQKEREEVTDGEPVVTGETEEIVIERIEVLDEPEEGDFEPEEKNINPGADEKSVERERVIEEQVSEKQKSVEEATIAQKKPSTKRPIPKSKKKEAPADTTANPHSINQPRTTKSENSLFSTVNWLKVAVITTVIGLALLFVAAAVQYYRSQQQHLLLD